MRRKTAVRLAVVIVVIAAYVAGHLWYGNRLHYFDLKIYYHAVNWWASGRDLYDYAQPDKIQGSLPFTYPPFAALVMFPMAWLPLSAVIAIVWLANVTALLVICYWLVTPVADRHGWPRWYALGVAVPVATGLEPVRETITFGQINLLLALLVLGDLLYATPRGSRWAGVGVGVASAIKLTPAIFILYLLLTRRWRAAATAVATAAACSIVALVYRPQDSWRFFTSAMWDTRRVGHLERISNQSLLGALARAVEPAAPNRLIWLPLAVLVGAYGLWRAASAWRAGDELTGVTVTALTGALVSPITWHHHLIWFIPALVILVDAVASGGRGRVWQAVLAAVVFVTVTLGVIEFYDFKLLSAGFERTVPGQVIADWYGVLTLVLLVTLPARTRAPAPQPPVAVAAAGLAAHEPA